MKSPVIEVENLVKRYKGSQDNAVDNIGFTVHRGELFALLGPNGAGKTTTISILTTLLAPTSGKATVVGHDILASASEVRKVVGVIFQNPSLDKNLTAEENIRIHAVLYGLYPFRPSYKLMPKAYKQRVVELASILGIEADIFKPVHTFSGGMKRKLEIVRSLIHKPEVLFLDEPTTGLDAASRRNLWKYLREVQAESGTTLLLTTHYIEEAEQADTICIINKGKIVSYGSPSEVKAELIEDYLLVDADDREQLRNELHQLRIEFSEVPQFKISLNGHSAHQLVKTINTPLTMLKLHQPTLEDAYLEILERA